MAGVGLEEETYTIRSRGRAVWRSGLVWAAVVFAAWGLALWAGR